MHASASSRRRAITPQARIPYAITPFCEVVKTSSASVKSLCKASPVLPFSTKPFALTLFSHLPRRRHKLSKLLTMSLISTTFEAFFKRYVVQNDCTLETCLIELAKVLYDPSLGGSAVYLTIFAVLVPIQAYFGIRHCTWSFFGVVTAGLILEIVGYVARIQLHFNPFLWEPFVMYVSSRSFFIPFVTFKLRKLTTSSKPSTWSASRPGPSSSPPASTSASLG